jgi:outer membrane protein TolC
MMGKRTLLLCVVLSLGVGAAAAQAPHRLTLREAIETGLKNNLRVLVAGTQVDEAAGTRQRRLAALLPVARGESYANLQNRNLRAFGIEFPGVPDTVGPFSNYDFRVAFDQPLLDLRSYHRLQASRRQEEAARHNFQDIRDLIIRQIAGLYLNAQSAAARVDAAASRVTTAEALYQLAVDQRDAGVATGVDVLRAQVLLANEQQRLLEARNRQQQALLALARAIGLDLAVPLELAEPLEFKPVETPDIPAALDSALLRRPDYLALQSQQQALGEEQRSNRGRFWPRVSVGGNYGALGRTLNDVKGTGLLQGTVSIALFDWDRQGERTELESRRRRLAHQVADLRQGIEEEIRDALLVLDSAAQEVAVAEQGLSLARRELELARDRFQAGVTDNIEVVTAQESVSRAQENRIVAVTRYTDAKTALARALGATEETYAHYLGIR